MRNLAYSNTVANQSLGQVRRTARTMTKTIPFDYVFEFILTGQRGNKVQDVVEISIEGVFVAVSIGYSLAPDQDPTARAFGPEMADTKTLSDITLGEIARGLEAIGVDLTHGFRINPDFAYLSLADPLSPEEVDKLFEPVCVPAEEVSFLYSIDSVGAGRELQSQPIHNIAGLGIPNGDRPFRPFAKPIMFEPRASIRIQIEELSGPPGTLFIVLQGYKILGSARTPE
jgi:hypothetical protein